MFSTGFAIKLVPVIVTVVPINPAAGVKDAIKGGMGSEIILWRTETVLL